MAAPLVLDNPVWAALTGPHAHLAERHGGAVRYPADLSPFHGIAGPAAWGDLAALAGPGARVFMSGPYLDVPAGWTPDRMIPGVQLTGDRVHGEPDPEAADLTGADVPEVLDLVARTEPGPFRKRTLEFGRYLGIRRDGMLVAMAGERLRVPGWTEISAVCTDPAHRGQGLAARLIRALTHGIRARGETPFLAAAADNVNAVRLYRTLGFTIRRDVTFAVVHTPRRPGTDAHMRR
jgi:ribosomal protein S18 acetylase RimI-like enzyme